MNIGTAQQHYLDQLQIERGLSANTIAAYRRDLEKFATYLAAHGNQFDALSSADILAFEVDLKNSALSLSSVNRSISALKGFYRYCSSEYSISDPTTEAKSAKIARKLPKALTIDEISRMIESVKSPGEPISLRDFAILEFLYSTGGRVSEIIGLNTADISQTESAEGSITVVKLRGKGSKERIVPVGKFAVAALDDYLVRTRPGLHSKNPRSEPALFLNSRGTRLSLQSAWKIVLKAADATGLSGKVSPHVFRHSYATHLLDGGADIRVVQELLGHASVTTTQIYTLITIDKVRESYSLAHPRAQ